MGTRRAFLGATAAALTGCIGNTDSDNDTETNESDEGEPEFVVTASKDTLELPRDSVGVTLRNEGDGYGGYNSYWRIYKRVGDDWRFVAPHDTTLRLPLLHADSEETRTFTVDSTDPGARGQNEDGGWTFWGLNPGRYAVEPANEMYTEFDVVGEPPDFEDIVLSYDIREEDSETVIYAKEEELHDVEPSMRVTPTDDDGAALIEEQLNQLGAVRDAVLHVEDEATIYTDEVGTIDSYLEWYVSESRNVTEEDRPIVFEYDDNAYRVETV